MSESIALVMPFMADTLGGWLESGLRVADCVFDAVFFVLADFFGAAFFAVAFFATGFLVVVFLVAMILSP
jgi:hypothetical protein